MLVAGVTTTDERPTVQVRVSPDLHRSRLTVFFRSLLALPHTVWLLVYGIAATLVAWVAFFAALFMGRLPAGMHGFLSDYVRYASYVRAYRLLVVNRYPPFSGRASYDVDIVIPPPPRQRRLTVFFRGLLVLAAALWRLLWALWMGLVRFAAFWYALFMGRLSEGLERRLVRYLVFNVRVTAYQLYLVDRFPSPD